MPVIVVDTNILVGALLRNGGTARRVIRGCLTGEYEPVIGTALFAEYEDVFMREQVWSKSLVKKPERDEIWNAFLSTCRWVEVFFAWRPNLPDEDDNHLVELAVAANAQIIVSRNVRDLSRGELRFPALTIMTPEQILEAYPCRP